ncbi:phage repressor protein/antirepressor Ant [Ruminococcus sp. AM54-1NS]|nr:phage repressor protein/antirepressor Ant [Ruminococcus sp. AM54-1NS]
MDGIKTFTNKEFGTVRTIVKDGEPWFVGKDVAEILGYTKARNAIARHVDDDDKKDAPFQGVLGGKQTMTIINESGLYSLILGSKLPKAKTFKRWVTSEVLPTIRKTGGYVANNEIFINTYLPNADAQTRELFRLNLSTIRQLNNKIEQDKPLVDFASHIQTSEDCISMNDMAKLATKNGIKIGRTRLFNFLREKKVLGCKDGHKNMPYQRYIDTQPWFQLKESSYIQNGEVRIGLTPMVTPKGQSGIIRMLRKCDVTG